MVGPPPRIGQEVRGHLQHPGLARSHRAPDPAAQARASLLFDIEILAEAPQQHRPPPGAEEKRKRDVRQILHLMADDQRIETAAGDPQKHRLVDQRAAENAPEAIAQLDILEAEGRNRSHNPAAGLRLAMKDDIVALRNGAKVLIECAAVGGHAALMQDRDARVGHGSGQMKPLLEQLEIDQCPDQLLVIPAAVLVLSQDALHFAAVEERARKRSRSHDMIADEAAHGPAEPFIDRDAEPSLPPAQDLLGQGSRHHATQDVLLGEPPDPPGIRQPCRERG